MIDPGHGGSDSGAVGFGRLEKDWTLAISLYQYKRLEELGARVALSRAGDETLPSYSRVARIKDQYDYCISNHWNAFNGQARGVETIHSYRANPLFAQKLADQIVKDSGLPLRRVFSRKTANQKSDYYFMHRLTGTTKTVIIEYGFIDHKLDASFYAQEDHFYRVAEGVVKVVCAQIGISYQPAGGRGVLAEKGQQGPARTSSGQAGPSSTKSSLSRLGKISTRQAGPELKKSGAQAKELAGKRLRSIHRGRLRFYNKASWKNQDVFGYLTYGQCFPRVLQKVQVGLASQYQVENSKGQRFYVTASPKYVELI